MSWLESRLCATHLNSSSHFLTHSTLVSKITLQYKTTGIKVEINLVPDICRSFQCSVLSVSAYASRFSATDIPINDDEKKLRTRKESKRANQNEKDDDEGSKKDIKENKN